MRVSLCVLFALWAFVPTAAQEPKQPALIVSCADKQPSYAATETVNLTITIENRGKSDFYVYSPLEWGWTGLWFYLLDAKGNVVRPRQPVIAPLPPPPVYDKSQLVGVAPGYFYGRHFKFGLSDYNLKPGTYFIAFKYQSYYHERDGFGLPILTSEDGEFLANRVEISVRQA